MTDPLTTATRIRDALTAYIDAAEALPPEVRALLLDSGGHWTGAAVASVPKVEPEHPDIVKPYRLELLRTTPVAHAGWCYESTFMCKDQAIRRGASRAEHRRVFNGARVIDRRTDEVVWEWAKDVDPPTDNP